MIEPTDEMERAYDDTAWENPVELGGLEMANVRAGLAAVLEIVERDYRLTRICGAELGTSMRCERAEHDQGEHEAIAPGGSLVRWL